MGAKIGRLSRRGGEGGSKRSAKEELEAWDWGRLLVRVPASGAVLGRAFSCRWCWGGFSSGTGCLAGRTGEGGSRGSPTEDADA